MKESASEGDCRMVPFKMWETVMFSGFAVPPIDYVNLISLPILNIPHDYINSNYSKIQFNQLIVK